MSDYGFTFNTSAVIDENDKISIGVDYKDSNGFKFNTQEHGEVDDVADNLYQRFLTEYLADAVRRAQEEKKAETSAPKAEVATASDNLIQRLRKLEQENAKYKKMLDEKHVLTDEEKAKAQAASDKYKDKNYNKPTDAPSKPVIKKGKPTKKTSHRETVRTPADMFDLIFDSDLLRRKSAFDSLFDNFWSL